MRRLIGWCVVLALGGTSTARADTFGDHWQDGRAELNGYRLVVDRYGAEREGTAVLIFVTEPFSESKRVKVDRPRGSADEFEALKLNLVRDFQTGIYDYNTMVSVFARTETMEPVKVSFSSAEWCGHVYQELRVDPEEITGFLSSYFEDESQRYTLAHPEDGVLEDALFIQLRGLREPFLEPGETREVPFLPGMLASRFVHRSLEWTTAVIERAAETRTVEVPAGPFVVTTYTVRVAGGRTGTVDIEAAWPHRVIGWRFAPDVRAELLGSTRNAYWNLNGPGGEAALREIGLR